METMAKTGQAGLEGIAAALPKKGLPPAPYPGAGRIAAMTDEELRARFAGTALLRSKPAGLRRNAAIARENAARAGGASA